MGCEWDEWNGATGNIYQLDTIRGQVPGTPTFLSSRPFAYVCVLIERGWANRSPTLRNENMYVKGRPGTRLVPGIATRD